jgi:alpha-tubulin suppressor-like RCC1 family protein
MIGAVVRSLLALSIGSLWLLAGCERLFGLDRLADPPKDDSGLADTPPGECGHRGVATGRRHTCAIDAAGAVWCWGLNVDWQVKAGEPAVVVDPVKIDTLPAAAVQIAAGRSVSCARLVDGSVWCWGNNNNGEIGVGTFVERLAPTPVDLGGDRAVDVEVGAFHVCIRRESDRSVMCWGSNRVSELGVASPTEVASPTLVAGTAGMQQLSVGHRHTCGISAAGTVQCWGKGDNGQLGQGNVTTPMVTEAIGVANATSITAAGRSTCAVAGGGARCWGSNEYGQLGTGTFTDVAAPGSIVSPDAVDVALGTSGACALAPDGRVECWGALLAGDGTLSTSTLPRPSSVTSVSSIAAGFYHVCAIVDGAVKCWGENTYGALGRGTRDIAAVPTAVALPDPVFDFGVSTSHACAILTSGEVYCWGSNSFGQLGDGSHSSTYVPVKVTPGIPGLVGIAARFGRTCVWNGADARCWGQDTFGILGTGASSHDRPSPAAVIATGVKYMRLGNVHTCAATSANGVQCWGRNSHGQLGNGTTTNSLTPVTVAAGTVDQLVAGGNFNCARKSDASVECWGENAAGQLGDNTTIDRTAPVAVSGLSLVTDISAGNRFACAITSGNLFCWGSNDFGQLGLGDLVNRAVPTQVTLPAAAVDVELGGSSACAQLSDQRVFCWGAGDVGQLANGQTPAVQDLPVEVPLANADRIGISTAGGCALRSGALVCWGVTPLLGNGDISSAEPRPTALVCP